jgi:DNA polymerase III delta subunit
MLYIFHGDDLFHSREAHQNFLDQFKDKEIMRQEYKDFDFEKLNLFVNSPSLFQNTRILALYNPFSLAKNQLEKLSSLIKENQYVDTVIWQDRNLRQNEISFLGAAKAQKFPLDKQLFSCLNSLKPRNHRLFTQTFLKVIKQEPFELIFFWFKNRLRQNLSSFSPFSPDKLKSTYLALIDLDYQIKTGTLPEPKENALLELLFNLMS